MIRIEIAIFLLGAWFGALLMSVFVAWLLFTNRIMLAPDNSENK